MNQERALHGISIRLAKLYVLSGIGLMGLRNKSPQTINAGDTVDSPGEEHWHRPLLPVQTHIAIQEALNGSVAKWLEKVSDKQYQFIPD